MPITTQVASVPAGQSLSNAVDCSAASPIRIRMPPAWTGGNRGIITFQVSTDNVTFMDYFRSDGQEISAIVTPGTTVQVDTAIGGKFGGLGGTFIKIRAGTRESPVVQQAKTDFIVVLAA